MSETTDTKKIIAAEGGHFYYPDGTPAYTVIGKNGKERNTTLRDCKKLGLFPSVTEVLKILARPSLEAWKSNNLLLAAATMPYKEGITLEEWCDLVIKDAKEQSEKAMQLGTDIHAEMEKSLFGEEGYNPYYQYTSPVISEMTARGIISGHAEKSFSHPLGYGGKIDFYNDNILLDFKTSSKKSFDEKTPWPDHLYQLAAYRYGIQKPHLKCMNIYISTTKPGVYYFYEWSEEDLDRGLKVFLKTLELWRLVKGI